MKLEYWPLNKILPYAQNARKIPQAAIDKVAASIREYNWRQPIVVDKDGVIVVGHVRHLAAQKLGLDQAPVHVAENLTPAQIRGYRLMDNRSHEETDWNEKLLSIELGELKDLDFDLGLTGFTGLETDRLLSGLGEECDAETLPLPAAAVSQIGDLWILGPHRLLCGDATDAEAVGRLFGSASPKLMATDPPYGVDYDPDWRERAGLGRQRHCPNRPNCQAAPREPARRYAGPPHPGDSTRTAARGLLDSHNFQPSSGVYAVSTCVQFQFQIR